MAEQTYSVVRFYQEDQMWAALPGGMPYVVVLDAD